jgi:hypothetical protein
MVNKLITMDRMDMKYGWRETKYYRILIRKLQGRSPFWRPSGRCTGNIKMYLKGIRSKGVN